MAIKKRSPEAAKPTLRRTGRFVRAGDDVSSGPPVDRAKALKAGATRVAETTGTIPLTDADVARIDAICDAPPQITDHMRAAINRHRQMADS